MRVDALASGSSGNAYLLRSETSALLLEAGIAARKLASYLTQRGFDPRRLDGILLTHAHSDHLQGARELSDRYGVPIFATAGTLGHPKLRDSTRARAVESGQVVEIGDLEVLPFSVPHDCVEPVGYRVVGQRATVCLTTDLGFVPDELLPHLHDADLLVLEANHDEEMLWRGPYPEFLKRRVAGTSGHLSNLAAAQCAVGLGHRPPRDIWLAHLSLVNNRVGKAVEVVRRALREADLSHVEVAAAGRNRPSLAWQSEPQPEQLALL